MVVQRTFFLRIFKQFPKFDLHFLVLQNHKLVFFIKNIQNIWKLQFLKRNFLHFSSSDAIAIVLTSTVSRIPDSEALEALASGFKTFLTMFFASAGIGTVFALISALLLKHIDLRKHPSLEFGLMLVFTYGNFNFQSYKLQ